MRREPFRKKTSVLGLVFIAVCSPMLGQRSTDSKMEKAIPEIAVIEADLEALPIKDLREGIDPDKLDVPEGFVGDLRGSLKASNGVDIKKVMHWTEDGAPFAIEFEGKGYVALDIPRKITTFSLDDETKLRLKTHEDVFFVTVAIQPALSIDPNELSYLLVGGAVVGFGLEPPTRGIRAANMFLLNGDAKEASLEDWFASGITFPVNQKYQLAMPIHLTFRFDLDAGDWDLFFRGQLRFASIDYGNPLKQIVFVSAGEGPSRLFELAETATNPLFTDADFDGIDDEYEEKLGFSTSENDRYALDELGEFTNIQHFINLGKKYGLRSERELERVLSEAIAEKQLGHEPSEKLKSLQIPDELRERTFTKEDLEIEKVEATKKLIGFGRKPEDRTEDRHEVIENGKEGE